MESIIMETVAGLPLLVDGANAQGNDTTIPQAVAYEVT
jgi:hypothetical protein